MKMAFAGAVVALLAASPAGPAWGQTCVVSSIGNLFATYNPIAATAQTSTSTVSVTRLAALAIGIALASAST